ncbi:MAG: pyridoxal phosphate-dependent aminotransferase [bacterium]|nr:pyridoxal phosphate-dependent aminotransferase [bacterium]
MDISTRAKEVPESPIRKLASVAVAAKKRGIHVYHLNIGQPDIHTPEVYYQSIRDYSDKVLAYGPSDGLPDMKEAMVDYFSRYGISLDTGDILVTCGGSEAVSFAFNVVADPGGEIIIPEPFYANYSGYARLAGMKIVPIPTRAEEGYHLPPMAEIEKRITPNTRALMICSPNNPTGTVFTKEEITGLGELAVKHDLFLIADEVYKEFTYDGDKHFSILELEGLEDRAIVVDSISKRYSACGARIGAVISRSKEVIGAILKFGQARLCPPTLEQIGATSAYRLPLEFFKDILAEYQERRDVMVDILTSNKDIVLRKPKGAFYIMAKLPIDDCDKFAKWMLGEFDVAGETVMVAPGAGFYSTPGKGKQEVRIAYVLDTKKLEKAGNIILKAIEAYNS